MDDDSSSDTESRTSESSLNSLSSISAAAPTPDDRDANGVSNSKENELTSQQANAVHSAGPTAQVERETAPSSASSHPVIGKSAKKGPKKSSKSNKSKRSRGNNRATASQEGENVAESADADQRIEASNAAEVSTKRTKKTARAPRVPKKANTQVPKKAVIVREKSNEAEAEDKDKDEDDEDEDENVDVVAKAKMNLQRIKRTNEEITSAERIREYLETVSDTSASEGWRFQIITQRMCDDGIVFREGRFSGDEKAILRANWEALCERARAVLANTDKTDVLARTSSLLSNPEALCLEDLEARSILLEISPCWLLEVCYGLQRPPHIVYRKCCDFFLPFNRGRFSVMEDAALREAIERTRETGEQVPLSALAKELNRTLCAVKDRVRELTVDHRNTGPWTDEEELALVRALREHFGAHSLVDLAKVAQRDRLPWTALAAKLSTRSTMQLRKHWLFGFRRKLAGSIDRVSKENEPDADSSALAKQLANATEDELPLSSGSRVSKRAKGIGPDEDLETPTDTTASQRARSLGTKRSPAKKSKRKSRNLSAASNSVVESPESPETDDDESHLRGRSSKCTKSYQDLVRVLVENGLAKDGAQEVDINWKFLFKILSAYNNRTAFASYVVMQARFRKLLSSTAQYIRANETDVNDSELTFCYLVNYLYKHPEVVYGRFASLKDIDDDTVSHMNASVCTSRVEPAAEEAVDENGGAEVSDSAAKTRKRKAAARKSNKDSEQTIPDESASSERKRKRKKKRNVDAEIDPASEENFLVENDPELTREPREPPASVRSSPSKNAGNQGSEEQTETQALTSAEAPLDDEAGERRRPKRKRKALVSEAEEPADKELPVKRRHRTRKTSATAAVQEEPNEQEQQIQAPASEPEPTQNLSSNAPESLPDVPNRVRSRLGTHNEENEDTVQGHLEAAGNALTEEPREEASPVVTKRKRKHKKRRDRGNRSSESAADANANVPAEIVPSTLQAVRSNEIVGRLSLSPRKIAQSPQQNAAMQRERERAFQLASLGIGSGPKSSTPAFDSRILPPNFLGGCELIDAASEPGDVQTPDPQISDNNSQSEIPAAKAKSHKRRKAKRV